MARYRIGETPDTIGAIDANDNSLVIGTAVFGLVTGIGFFYAGLRTRMLWLIFWGAGLAIASLLYLGHRIVN